MTVLGEYFRAAGDVLGQHQATVGQIQGDGVMAYFNDPLPCDEPARRATEMALALRPRLDQLTAEWKANGHDLSYGIGISLGYATLGLTGFEGRQEYGPVGTVANLASRLCGRAVAGQILMDQKTYSRVSSRFAAERLEPMEIKGFPEPVAVVSITGEASTDHAVTTPPDWAEQQQAVNRQKPRARRQSPPTRKPTERER